MGLEKMSDDDLIALKSGDITKVSDAGLVELKSFSSTPGGAATGNPSMLRQGDRQRRATLGGDLQDIGLSGGLGAVAGYVAPEILTAAGLAAGAFPVTAGASKPLMSMGSALRGSRGMSALSGGVSGLASETAGKASEELGYGTTTSEAARIVGGGITPEFAGLAVLAAQKAAGMTGLTSLFMGARDIIRKYTGKDVNLTEAQTKYLTEQVDALRGGGKTNDPLEAVGNVMGAEARRLTGAADQGVASAKNMQANVGRLGPVADRELADIGGDLRGVIAPRFEAGKVARSAEYTKNEVARDAIVKSREGAKSFVDQLPEYKRMIAGLESELKPGKRSDEVQKSIKHILRQLESGATTPSEQRLVQTGRNLDLVTQPGQKIPISFKALDDVRRSIGQIFEGKPPEGYAALKGGLDKDLYGQITAIQKKFAGGDDGPHAKLLQDYANSSEALAMFRSKTGKRATALDLYNEAEFATDASTLPKSYFKSRASIAALKELTGNDTLVNKSAMEYANKEIQGKNGPQVRDWMTKNSEWLEATPIVRGLLNKYAGKLEVAEVGMRNAQDFATKVAKDVSLLTRQALPAQRAVELIKSGDTELWAKIAPAITQSPQASKQMMSAVRQVLADQSTSKETTNLFSRNIRPFLEQSNMAQRGELDFIAEQLAKIQTMNIPESQKLGPMKRILLQATGGWTASLAARGNNFVSREYLVPQESQNYQSQQQ